MVKSKRKYLYGHFDEYEKLQIGTYWNAEKRSLQVATNNKIKKILKICHFY